MNPIPIALGSVSIAVFYGDSDVPIDTNRIGREDSYTSKDINDIQNIVGEVEYLLKKAGLLEAKITLGVITPSNPTGR
jgi:hypothetical protein